MNTRLAIAMVAALAAAPLHAQDAPAPDVLMVTSVAEAGDGSAASPVPEPSSPYRFSSFKRDVSAAALEVGAITAVIALPRIYRRAKGSEPFHFNSEGWFGRDTYSLGMDKMLHSWKTYVITDVVQSAIARRTGDRKSAAITAGIVGAGLMTLAEVGDGFSETTGFAKEDGVVHLAGAGFSVLRNLVPGMREKVDYRLEIKPVFDGSLSDTRGRLAHSRYLFALQLNGFKSMQDSPLRVVELHAGYYARGFSAQERAKGDPLKRRLFVGAGFNLQALFRRKPQSKLVRWTRGALDYVQVPYTSIY